MSIMPRKLRCLTLVCAVAPLLFSPSASAQDRPAKPVEEPAAAKPIEPWADPALKVTRGLALWLDAGKLNAARQAHGRPEASDGARVGTWYDGSGNGRHVAQLHEAAQPLYQDGALRFDGEASYMERAGAAARLGNFTLFIVAAPFSNAGGFRALFATHEQGQVDFTSGVTVDMGSGFSTKLDTLNVEGEGFGGMLNLMAEPFEFGVVRRMSVTSAPGHGGTKLYVDGKAARSRGRQPSVLDIDRITIGARYFGFPPEIRGFLDGDILQVLVYDRVLPEAERRKVEAYLAARLGGKASITRPLPTRGGKPLVSVPNPPPVQILVPGFSVRELPLDLANINNVKYRADGKLVALSYGGDIDVLSDHDGDGVEEHIERFWENNGSLVAPIGMALTPEDYHAGNGVFVASKGKISLILDVDRDGKADKEIVVARGWKELPHGVDALGVALDAAGNVYFGLGTTDYTNAYRLDAAGTPKYDVNDEHGTIQKVSADFRQREIIATGIRFPVALAFNRLGDLFATDQEGATWLANGNPFDELLHIQPKRHYGFPPRHPKYLPSVIDEPSVFDYGPQHQSTCGLNFNDPWRGSPAFGPAHWAGDALVAGYSRGKLFRTKLARTPSGYVAQNQLFAVLNMLAADACVSPGGALVVAAHSGQPDWGSGPRGKGKLYKIEYSDREAPQPVLAWASGPQEVCIAFDRPLELARLQNLARSISIEYGASVRPGDRFESLRPGYEAVARQMAAPRFELPVLSTQVSADRRWLSLYTAPIPEACAYAISAPYPGSPAQGRPQALAQVAAVDLGYDLCGVSANWRPRDGENAWSGWLPHVDLSVAKAFTKASALHDQLWDAIKRPGLLTLNTKLDLWQMLHPAVQPGSSTGYTLPDEEVSLELIGSGPIEVTMLGESTRRSASEAGRYRVRLKVKPRERHPVPVEITLATEGQTSLEVSYTTQEDNRPRALPLRRFLLPWAAVDQSQKAIANRDFPELKGGVWSRGRAIFFGEQSKCSTCHKVRGRGGDIGPDLSSLVHRDYTSVLRDIHTPAAAINPDFIAHNVALSDGRVLNGTLRTEGDRLIVGDTTGRQIVVNRADVETTSPASTSIMPDGLDAAIGQEKLRDLLTFLLTEPLSPAVTGQEGAPPERRRLELNAVLDGSIAVQNPKRLRIVLAAGPKDHGPGEHDYPLWLKRWASLFATDAALNVETSDGWPSARQLEKADVAVFYSNNPGWDKSRATELDRFLARGGGVVLIHYAVDGHQEVKALADRIGLAWQGGKSAFRHGPLEVDFSRSKHPITRGFDKLQLLDESYWNLVGDTASVNVIGTGVEDAKPRPLFWSRESGNGRVFVSIPGHFTWTFDDPLFRVLILRGIAWTAKEPVDRFNELATLGARIGE
jgi:putative heme-binding domain-containing protein